MDIALVPARFGKTRLRSVLSPAQRVRLQAAMLDDVLAALRASQVSRVVVAAGDDDVAGRARLAGVDVVRDPARANLNAAISHATATVAQRRDVGVLVVAADLPTLTATEVDRLLTATRRTSVVIAPTKDGGTGALLRRPGGVIDASYGLGSAARHAELGRHASVPVLELIQPGTSLDVDHPDDLDDAAASQALGPHTRAVLNDLAHRST